MTPLADGLHMSYATAIAEEGAGLTFVFAVRDARRLSGAIAVPAAAPDAIRWAVHRVHLAYPHDTLTVAADAYRNLAALPVVEHGDLAQLVRDEDHRATETVIFNYWTPEACAAVVVDYRRTPDGIEYDRPQTLDVDATNGMMALIAEAVTA